MQGLQLHCCGGHGKFGEQLHGGQSKQSGTQQFGGQSKQFGGGQENLGQGVMLVIGLKLQYGLFM